MRVSSGTGPCLWHSTLQLMVHERSRTRGAVALDVDPDGADCVHGSETAIIASKSLVIAKDCKMV